jgi:hypothetical protein
VESRLKEFLEAQRATAEEKRDEMTKNLQVEHQQEMLIDEFSRLSEEDRQKLSDVLEWQKDADVSDAHMLYCELMRNYGDPAYQEDSVPRNRAEKRAQKRPIKGGSPGGLRQMPVGSLESLLRFRGR